MADVKLNLSIRQGRMLKCRRFIPLLIVWACLKLGAPITWFVSIEAG